MITPEIQFRYETILMLIEKELRQEYSLYLIEMKQNIIATKF